MSEVAPAEVGTPVPQQDENKTHWPVPFFPQPNRLPAVYDEDGNYHPVDPFDEAFRLLVGSGIVLGGWHLRGILQLRKGSQRPGTAKAVNMFQTTKRQLIGIPVALGVCSFTRDCLMNINEGERPMNDFFSTSLATAVGLSINGGLSAPRIAGLSFGVGVVYGWARWAGGFDGLREHSHSNTKQAGEIRPLEETNGDVRDDRQGFWEVVYRRPLSQTVEDLGEGRGILKP